MKLTNYDLKKIIKEELDSVIKEVQFQDPIAGKMGYTVALFIKLLCLKKHIEKFSKILNIGYMQDSDDYGDMGDLENVLQPEKYGIKPSKTPLLDLNGQTITINFYDVGHESLTKKLTLNAEQPSFARARGDAKKEYNQFVLKDYLKNAIEHYEKEIEKLKRSKVEAARGFAYNTRDKKKGVKKRRTKLNMDTFSGKLRLNIKLHQGMDQVDSEGAAYNPQSKDLFQSVSIPIDYFNIFQPQKRLKDFGRNFKSSVDMLKGNISHELIHVTQGEIVREPTIMNKITNMINPVRAAISAGYNPFLSDIDPKKFPAIAELQDTLEDIVRSHFFLFSSEDDLKKLNIGTHEAKEAVVAFKVAKRIGAIFAPQEIEAYVRGFYSEVRKETSNKKMTVSFMEMKLESHFGKILNPESMKGIFSKENDDKIQNLLIKSKEDAVKGMMEEFYKIFGGKPT